MSRKTIFKIIVDIGMTVTLMLLMAFEMVGREAHEWIGMGMFLLFVIHHMLNHTWTKNIRKGRYTPFRIVQMILVFLIFVYMIASMMSGIVLSNYVFSAVHIRGISHTARMVHMLAAYWGYVFMSFHLGLHWAMMMGMAGRMVKKKSKVRTWVLRGIGVLIAGYGIYAFIEKDFVTYMFLKIDFVFYDFEKPLILFLLDYLAIMGLFVWIGHYSAIAIKNGFVLNSKNS